MGRKYAPRGTCGSYEYHTLPLSQPGGNLLHVDKWEITTDEGRRRCFIFRSPEYTKAVRSETPVLADPRCFLAFRPQRNIPADPPIAFWPLFDIECVLAPSNRACVDSMAIGRRTVYRMANRTKWRPGHRTDKPCRNSVRHKTR